MKKRYPRTREHTTSLVSRQTLQFRSNPDTPALVKSRAEAELVKADIAVPSDIAKPTDDFKDLLEHKKGDPVFQDIAWCLFLAHDAETALATIPEPYRDRALRACIDMFQAGKRHEGADEHDKHAGAIHARRKSNKNIQPTEELSVGRYDLERPKHTKHASLALALRITERGLTKWERKHKRRWVRVPRTRPRDPNSSRNT